MVPHGRLPGELIRLRAIVSRTTGNGVLRMARRRDDVAWADPALLILGSLATGAKHGYAIVQDTEHSVGITLGPGTLYAALARLEERGHVRALPEEDRRRPYEITAAGSVVLAERLRVMQGFARRGLASLRAAQA
jgi:DNA-binding PadR family transcriptional regulator